MTLATIAAGCSSSTDVIDLQDVTVEAQITEDATYSLFFETTPEIVCAGVRAVETLDRTVPPLFMHPLAVN